MKNEKQYLSSLLIISLVPEVIILMLLITDNLLRLDSNMYLEVFLMITTFPIGLICYLINSSFLKKINFKNAVNENLYRWVGIISSFNIMIGIMMFAAIILFGLWL